MFRLLAAAVGLLVSSSVVCATPPVLSFIFPAGGQRGATVPVRVGGLFLHQKCGFEIVGRGVTATPVVKRTDRVWFEGSILPLPESQQSEDYPADMLGSVSVAKDAKLGPHHARVWTSQGAASGPLFVVGELSEVVEHEIDGDPIAIPVKLPVTANGRIFPREEIDLWSFAAKRGETITAFVQSTILNSPMVAKLEILDSRGHVLAEQSPRSGAGQDAAIRFTATADGTYQVRVRDARNLGGPAYVYRLTISSGPVVDLVFPIGGRRGSTVTLQQSGSGLTSPTATIAIPADAANEFAPTTNGFTLDVDDLPEHVGPIAEAVTTPAILNGRIERPGARNEWKITLKKGEKYELELRARKLGSPLCGIISVSDATGKEIARSEPADPTTDANLTVQPAADGIYTVLVSERFAKRGGSEFAYRLKVREQSSITPGFRLLMTTDVANVPRGGTSKLKISVERFGGFAGPIELTATNLPGGITAKNVTLAANQATIDFSLAADTNAKIVPHRVAITGTAIIAARPVKVTAMTGELDHLLVTATVPTPFKFTGEYTMSNAPRGQPYRRSYKLERNGFVGPITIQMADRQIRHLQGVTASPIVVPSEKAEFEYAANLPAWIETGRTCRVTLMASGIVRDADGTEHTVAFTSTEQNHQMIVVPEPGVLAIETEASSLRVEPGKTVKVPVRISRAKGLVGAVAVEAVLPKHWKGIRATPMTVAADREVGELQLTFDAGANGPFNMPMTLRATLGLVVAEAKLELVAAD